MATATGPEDLDRRGHVPDGEGPIGNEWVSAVRSDLAECVGLARWMLETTGRMMDDMRVIRWCVIGEE